MKLTTRQSDWVNDRNLVKSVSVALLVIFALFPCRYLSGQVTEEAKPQPAPTKKALIDCLRRMFPLLEKKDFAGAAQFCMLPPDFKPEMLDGMLERQEISLAGIDVLDKEAKFGKAAELFGADRAGRYAKQANADLENCYGFFHTANSETAEVIAFWNGTEFKLIRLDDVGKIAGSGGAASDTMPSPDEAAKKLPELQANAEANPEDVTALANYAMALYQAGKLRESWAQLMMAYKVNPYHGGIERGIEVCLADFEKQGVLAANETRDKLEAALGSPQRSVDMVLLGRKRLVYAFLAVDLVADRVYELIDTRGATNVLFEPKEEIDIDLRNYGLFCGFRKKSKTSSSSKYYPAGQSLTDWTESVELERILGAARMGSLEELVQIMMEQIKKQHPEASHNVVASDDNSIIVGVVIPARPEYKFDKRYQLIRLLKGVDDVYRLAYTLKSDQLPTETEKKWREIFESAKLKSIR
jgi:hypothetical protein